jgi:hypothetical protein
MARIRSIHPSLFTDEQFAGLSDAAQIFYLGLLTEADDQGIFEWKPVTLRMRIRPSKDGPADDLLSEIEAAGKIASYEIGGRQYGAIRNFRKFQRPKSPNAIHPTTPHWRVYVGLEKPVPETKPDKVAPFPPDGEISPQMEDGGDNREEVERSEPPPPATTANSTRKTRAVDPKGQRLPSDWLPATAEVEFATSLHLDVAKVAAEFRDYWRGVPGTKGRKLDWPATFRNRCRELAGRPAFQKSRGASQPSEGWN